jgi:enamine deaminase RidA (YjgF/YER057c/UK114 family)
MIGSVGVFLDDMLKTRDFNAKWRSWIDKVVKGG